MQVFVGQKNTRFKQLLEKLVTEKFASQLAAHSAELWGADAATEASMRLGWLDFSHRADELLASAALLRSELNKEHINNIVLCGMGGSSLAPELISEWCNVPFTVLDSTHPEQVSHLTDKDLTQTAVIISSKSGTTAETRAHLAAFELAFEKQQLSPAARIILITDPGSALAEYGAAKGYRVFEADPLVGGRFSALTAFGLVPPTLAGAELTPLLIDAENALEICLTDSLTNPALQLAAALLADSSRFVALINSNAVEYQFLGDWIEQLVAESTGKKGQGILPIALNPAVKEFTTANFSYNNSVRIFVPDLPDAELQAHDIAVTGELGAQLIIWMVATAALGYLLQVNPFDQPDVESAKVAARAALSNNNNTITDAVNEFADPIAAANQALNFISLLKTSNIDYVMLQVYGAKNKTTQTALNNLRNKLALQLNIPVAAGFGPRYLHSTGQFHKGGRGTGAFLQFVAVPDEDKVIADGSGNTFGQLLVSQALGDAKVLQQASKVLQLQIADLQQLLQLLVAQLK